MDPGLRRDDECLRDLGLRWDDDVPLSGVSVLPIVLASRDRRAMPYR